MYSSPYILAAYALIAFTAVCYVTQPAAETCYIEVTGHNAVIRGCVNVPHLPEVVPALAPASGLSCQKFRNHHYDDLCS
ncbi:triple gene block protein 3 [Lily virus X]|uniref:Movement protein TGBp3 n=1 Tax=Lily virus X TaxID=12194 RepID=Q4LD43_LVX|nr:triple gene block protein 3 [Lily virus X]CAG24010.2 triple gene block protein 3 [Lily virus X]